MPASSTSWLPDLQQSICTNLLYIDSKKLMNQREMVVNKLLNSLIDYPHPGRREISALILLIEITSSSARDIPAVKTVSSDLRTADNNIAVPSGLTETSENTLLIVIPESCPRSSSINLFCAPRVDSPSGRLRIVLNSQRDEGQRKENREKFIQSWKARIVNGRVQYVKHNMHQNQLPK